MTLEMLRKIPLFSTLGPNDLEDLQQQLQREKYPAHTVVFWMDETGDKLYVIERGEVRISYSNKEGKEFTLATLGERAFFGELSLLDGGPHTATARTATETSLLTINRAAFYNYLDKHPQFSRTMLAVLVDRLRISTMRLREHNISNQTPLPPQPASFRRFVDRAARFVSSSRFLFFAIIFLIVWMGLQTWLYFRNHGSLSFSDNPPTFFVLGFILTLTSFLFTILVLTSQRGLAEHDRIQSEIEYQINLKAQSEIMRLQLKMDEILKLLEEKDKSK